MDNKVDQNQVGRLESRLDLVETELFAIDRLLRQVGFDQGIATLKAAACEFLKDRRSSFPPQGAEGN